MSYRIEEKLSIDKNNIIDFKSYLSEKAAKQIYKPRKIQTLELLQKIVLQLH